jgi:hypothetical protein
MPQGAASHVNLQKASYYMRQALKMQVTALECPWHQQIGLGLNMEAEGCRDGET